MCERSGECESVCVVSKWRWMGRGCALALWALVLLWNLAAPSQQTVEHWYSRMLYRGIVAVVAPVSELFPFSLALALIVLGVLGFIAAWVGNWLYRRRVLGLSHWRGLAWGPKWCVLLLPGVYIWFLLFWGMGYQRLPVEMRLEFSEEDVTEEELIAIRDGLLAVIVRDQPVEQEDRDVDRAIAAVARAMSDTVRAWESRDVYIPQRVKATPPGLLLMNGTAGVCVPFTLEPHVDGGLPDTAFVSVGAHELGHIAGVCDEGETNLLSYVAGLRADDPYARYAVALSVYRGVVGQLPNDMRRQALDALPEVAHDDMRRSREAQQRYRIDWFQKWSWRAYNRYLISQGVREGVRSYGRGTQLLVRAWRAGHLDLPLNTDEVQSGI